LVPIFETETLSTTPITQKCDKVHECGRNMHETEETWSEKPRWESKTKLRLLAEAVGWTEW